MINLSQRGRAGLEFLGSLQPFSSSKIRQLAKKDFSNDSDGKLMNEAHNKQFQVSNWESKIDCKHFHFTNVSAIYWPQKLVLYFCLSFVNPQDLVAD